MMLFLSFYVFFNVESESVLNAYLAKIPEIPGVEFWFKKVHFEIAGAG